MSDKQLQIKAYDSDGDLVKIIQDASFTGFSKYINGGVGQLNLRLARQIDTFDEDSDVTLGNTIKIYVSDEDDNDVLIYQGIVEEQNPYLDEYTEYVDIVCYGLVTRLKNDVLRDGTNTNLYTGTSDYLTTFSASVASVSELSNVVKAIIDKFNDVTSNEAYDINYSTDGSGSVEDTGVAIYYTFKAVKYFQAIEECRKIAPQNWYWYVEADGTFNWKGKPSSATHTFAVGQDIKSIRVNKSLNQTKNILLLWDGTSSSNYRKYEDDTSSNSYGRRIGQITDVDFGDSTTMDNFADAYINENKDPFVKIELEIFDNNNNDYGYDIESINPGDTCRITNIEDTSDLFDENMMITQVDWTAGLAKLTIAPNEFDINKFLIGLKDDFDKIQKNYDTGIDDSYSEIT